MKRRKTRPDEIIDEDLLLMYDPKLPTVISHLSTNSTIRGESMLEHELQHAFAAQYEKISQSFVFLNFIWVKQGKRRYLEIPAWGGAVPVRNLTSQSLINILLAPRHPSTLERDMAIHYKYPSVSLKRFLEPLLYKIKGGQTAESMLDNLRQEWRKLRAQDMK